MIASLKEWRLFGDNIYVTGTIGSSAIGLYLLKNKNDNLGLGQLDIQKLIRNIICQAKTQNNQLNKKVCSSSMDTTDGLINDLLVLAGSSGRKFIIKKNLIPYSISAKKFLNNYGDFNIALYGGDDYEVIFTSSMKFEDKLNEYAKNKVKNYKNWKRWKHIKKSRAF